MVREDPTKIAKQVAQQDDDFYGDETYAGSNPAPQSDDDVDEMMEKEIGNVPESSDPLDIAAEVDHDEEDIRHNPLPDDEPNLEDEEPDEPEE